MKSQLDGHKAEFLRDDSKEDPNVTDPNDDTEQSIFLLTDDAKDLFGNVANKAKDYEWPEQE